ncbi:hypothetical protein IFM89_034284 [Coptis chinensis]|uniref:Cytochrome P450 n=1 Tax=Coptis chinensis TaxID=261450 RepID=A0A835IIE1_9MAGN|nr:hypothetical protein IFM89_034284 [Coptis chinensis]
MANNLVRVMISKARSWFGEGIDKKNEYILSTVLVMVIYYAWMFKNSRKGIAPSPPGPRGLPLVGYLPFLEPDLNPYFARLAKIYGPIFKLKLGTRLCIVLSSPSVAKSVLKDHDAICGNHDPPAMGFASSYGGIDMV